MECPKCHGMMVHKETIDVDEKQVKNPRSECRCGWVQPDQGEGYFKSDKN